MRAGRTDLKFIKNKMQFYYTYVLESEKDGNLYVGFTKNLKERIKKHNLGNVESTKNRIPFKLIYFEACLSERGAVNREKQLKTGYGRAYLRRRLENN